MNEQQLTDNVISELSWIQSDGFASKDVRLQLEDTGAFSIHTGDASYDTDHSGYWGAGTLAFPRSPQDTIDLAKELVDQALDHMAQF